MKRINKEIKSNGTTKVGKAKASKVKKKTTMYSSMDKRICPNGSQMDERVPDSNGSNDAQWYARNPQLLADTASLPYNISAGATYHLPNRAILDSTGKVIYKWLSVNPQTLSGTMTLRLRPTIGFTDSPSDPINVAAHNIYSYVRHANSGHSNYDAPDLMLYILAVSNMMSYHSWLRRIYGTLNLFNVKNRYYPRAVIEAQLVDYDDLLANIAQFRGFINNYAVKIGSLCIPNTLDYFKRQNWLYSNIYLDKDSPTAQSYQFAPESFYKYSEVMAAEGNTYTGGYLEHTMIDHKLTFNDIIALGNNIADPILSSEDMNIMSGDILKAYGSEAIYKVPDTPETYTTIPVVNFEVLSQIQNLTCLSMRPKTPGSDSMSLWGIWQQNGINEGYLVSKPSIPANTGEAFVYDGGKVINMQMPHPSAADSMVATRLTALVDNHAATLTTKEGKSLADKAMVECGTEVVVAVSIAYGQTDLDTNTIKLKSTDMSLFMSYMDFKNREIMSYYFDFDWAPEIFVYITEDGQPTKVQRGIWDRNNITILHLDTLQHMNETAKLSLFAADA